MGLYLRKSVRVGPLRFNLSKSGIGVSTGIPGFRLGSGPRGAYVHMGGGGVYYRQSLGNRPRTGASSAPGIHDAYLEFSRSTVGPMADIDSASVSEMADVSPDDFLEELRAKRATTAMLPWVIGAGGLATYVLWASGVRGTPMVIALAIAGLLVWWVGARDAVRRTAVIGYDLDEQAAASYEALIEAFKALGSAGGLWHVPSAAQVHDRKYHAGASSVVNRTGVRPIFGQPPGIRTNVDVPMLKAGREQLCFMPDRVLIIAGAEVAAVSYGALLLDIGTTRFIEDGGVPTDAIVVDHTWRYVNKKGGPDRRFANNAQLPIALYETMHFRSTSGVNELFQVSRVGLGAAVAVAAAGLATG